jgi:hypothetical protein
MRNSKYKYYVYCPALGELWQYGSMRAANLGAWRKASACRRKWVFHVLRETEDTWEVWEGVAGGYAAGHTERLPARMLKILVHGESFAPWDAEVVQ